MYLPKPVIIEPNRHKYEYGCKKCGCNRSALSGNHQICKLCYEIKVSFSGNKVIDDFIRYTLGKMEFVPYNRFKNLEFIAEGGFSKIYKAIWGNGPIIYWNDGKQRRANVTVALKELNNSEN